MKFQNILPVKVEPVIDDTQLSAGNPMSASLVMGSAVVSDENPMPSSLVTRLSSELDTLDINKMSKGGVTIVHNAITATATSTETVDCRGHNGLEVECAVSGLGEGGSWQIEVLGCAVSGGTFGRTFDATLIGSVLERKISDLNAAETTCFTFRFGSNYAKIKATLTVSGTLTCKVTPVNL